MTMPPVSPLFSLYAHHIQPLSGTLLKDAAAPCSVCS
jgi:hypothetical protein